MTTPIGHNSVAGDEIKSIIERIERLEEEKKSYADDIKDVFAEAKGKGFDTKAIRSIVAMRKKDTQKLREEQEMRDLYMHAIGWDIFA